AVDAREDVDRPLPHARQRLERVARMVHLQIDALVLVLEHELAAVLEVAVLDVDERLPEVGQPEQQLVFDLLELAALDLPVARALVEPEGEELVAAAELLGEELVDEGDVVVELAHLEDLLLAEAEPAIPRAPRAASGTGARRARAARGTFSLFPFPCPSAASASP